MSQNFSSSVEKAITYLAKIQQPNGSFLSLSSKERNSFTTSITFHSVFSTALILQCITSLPESDQLTLIKNKAVAFLLAQKSPYCSWNYWDRNSKEFQNMPYPDDLDDTFCALTALYNFDPTLIDGAYWATITKLLTTLEIQEGGPYRTWLVNNKSPKIWQDVDLVVNTNIAFFLHLNDIHLPCVNRLINRAIKKEQFTTPYYPTPFPAIYFISRFIKGREERKQLQTCILQLETDNALDTALKVLTLLNLKYPLKRLLPHIESLFSSQNEDGSWDAAVFYTGVNPVNDVKFYAGSKALTTAFCLRALSQYSNKKDTSQKRVQEKLSHEVYTSIIKSVGQRFSLLGENLQVQANTYLQRIIKNDIDKQITLMPFYFSQSINKNNINAQKKFLIQLGTASIYGWIAYTIYDDFLDEEGLLPSLPLANICLRELTSIFSTIFPQETSFLKSFTHIMDQLEEANTWEVTYCRFDANKQNIVLPTFQDYKVLADRSLGHALGCLAVLQCSGYYTRKNHSNLLSFFRHFLIARQMNDDAHDWEIDLQNGHITSVVVRLLEKKRKNYLKLFWNETIDQVCDDIEFHTKKARFFLRKMDFLETSEYLDAMIKKQEKSVSLTRKEKQNTLLFLDNYS